MRTVSTTSDIGTPNSVEPQETVMIRVTARLNKPSQCFCAVLQVWSRSSSAEPGLPGPATVSTT